MKRLFILLLFLLPGIAFAQVRIITLPELEQWMQRDTDTLYVFNFWATWCKPCVEELPAFEMLQRQYKNSKVSVVLVSMDFKSQLEKTVIPFVKKNDLSATVVLLDAPNPNAWIDRISPEWSGALPATLLVKYSKNIRQFHEKQFTLKELQTLVQPFMENR